MNRKSNVVAGLCLGLLLLTGVAYAGDKDHEGHSDAAMTMHHMHVMINHAVEMAAEGSNLVMLGQMNMAERIDEISIQHGQKMIENAENLATEMLSGKAMKELHQHGHGKDDPDMAYTHELGNAALA